VYDGWDPAIHLIDSFEIPADWRRVRSIDFGFTNPFVCQWWALDPDGRMYLYRELYGTRKLVEDWCVDIVDLSQGERIEATYADHDAEDRATAERHGVYTQPANKAISPGIQRTQTRMRKAGDNKPRLFILRDSLVQRDSELEANRKPCSTPEEMEMYIWEVAASGKPNKEKPKDKDNHGADAMRYAVMGVDEGSLGVYF
jgi:phage terminase large subunit